MRLIVSGASGLVGSALVPALEKSGHAVARMVRPGAAATPRDILWDPAGGQLHGRVLEGADGLVHLAGESIASGRWTGAKKARIRDSRVNGTRLIAQTLAGLAQPPKVLVSASAIGYYGNRGEELLHEDSPPGTDFLANVCQAWEEATGPAEVAGIRVVRLRFGVILSRRGGALGRMLFPFRLGLGGRIGSGRQYISWITIDDAIGIIEHALATPGLTGPVNVVAPRSVTNGEFTRALARALHRPAILPMPAFAARLAFGEVADALLLASQRVQPARLTASGYRFGHTEIEPAMRHVLRR